MRTPLQVLVLCARARKHTHSLRSSHLATKTEIKIRAHAHKIKVIMFIVWIEMIKRRLGFAHTADSMKSNTENWIRNLSQLRVIHLLFLLFFLRRYNNKRKQNRRSTKRIWNEQEINNGKKKNWKEKCNMYRNNRFNESLPWKYSLVFSLIIISGKSEKNKKNDMNSHEICALDFVFYLLVNSLQLGLARWLTWRERWKKALNLQKNAWICNHSSIKKTTKKKKKKTETKKHTLKVQRIFIVISIRSYSVARISCSKHTYCWLLLFPLHKDNMAHCHTTTTTTAIKTAAHNLSAHTLVVGNFLCAALLCIWHSMTLSHCIRLNCSRKCVQSIGAHKFVKKKHKC